MTTRLELCCHAAAPCTAVQSVSVELQRAALQRLQLRYVINGNLQALRVPAAVPPLRAEQLWRHTCCELFVADREGAGYSEYNFSPSHCWAAYRFSGYRSGRQDLAMAPGPAISCRQGASGLALTAQLTAADWPLTAPAVFRLALAVVIEASDGGLSYWALRHAPGHADFHHATGFMELEL